MLWWQQHQATKLAHAPHLSPSLCTQINTQLSITNVTASPRVAIVNQPVNITVQLDVTAGGDNATVTLTPPADTSCESLSQVSDASGAAVFTCTFASSGSKALDVKATRAGFFADAVQVNVTAATVG